MISNSPGIDMVNNVEHFRTSPFGAFSIPAQSVRGVYGMDSQLELNEGYITGKNESEARSAPVGIA